jgi:hypothetical protein
MDQSSDLPGRLSAVAGRIAQPSCEIVAVKRLLAPRPELSAQDIEGRLEVNEGVSATAFLLHSC